MLMQQMAQQRGGSGSAQGQVGQVGQVPLNPEMWNSVVINR